MKQSSIAVITLAVMLPCGSALASAQSMDDLNLQIHGYATQGFIYSASNNWNTTDSTDGSAAWSEAVVNVSAQPEPKLRIGVQARYSLLGNLNNQITLDWAQADYKVNERLGFRIGKVKTPTGLLNESQDIDPSYLWVLLPQSIYPLASRNDLLSHYGGVVYGALPLGESLGKVEYRAFAGARVLAANDGYFQPYRDVGLTAPNGLTLSVVGGALRWNAPVRGLMVGASESFQSYMPSEIMAGPYQGTGTVESDYLPNFFGRYERNRLMVAGEYSRVSGSAILQFPGAPGTYIAHDARCFYAMTSYKFSEKLTGGVYYSYLLDHQAALTSARYQKDWALAARYDFNPYLYAKVEQHLVDGTESGFSTSDNSTLKPKTNMTMLKLGVSF